METQEQTKLAKPRRKWAVNIKMYVKYRISDKDWVHVTQER